MATAAPRARSSGRSTRCCSPTKSKQARSHMPDLAPMQRPELHRQAIDAAAFGIVEQPLSAWQRIGNIGAVRKLALLAILALMWEGYARWLNNPLLVPTFTSTVTAFIDAIASGVLPGRT